MSRQGEWSRRSAKQMSTLRLGPQVCVYTRATLSLSAATSAQPAAHESGRISSDHRPSSWYRRQTAVQRAKGVWRLTLERESDALKA